VGEIQQTISNIIIQGGRFSPTPVIKAKEIFRCNQLDVTEIFNERLTGFVFVR